MSEAEKVEASLYARVDVLPPAQQRLEINAARWRRHAQGPRAPIGTTPTAPGVTEP